LESRVLPVNHPDLPKDILVVAALNEEVNNINKARLDEIKGREHVYESINRYSNQKELKPKTDPSGAVKGTPLQKTLRLKVGAKVMLTYNLDTVDCLTNGAFGEVVGLNFNQRNVLTEVYVHFFNPDCGKEARKNLVSLQKKFPGKNVVAIKPMEFSYSLSQRSTGGVNSNNATIFQFPLRLGFASTAHKVQGMTIRKPNKLIIDARNVREAAQYYVMLSRVQSMDQLIILESVCPERIKASPSALFELYRMETEAISLESTAVKSLLSCNIRSAAKNLKHLLSSKSTLNAQVICIQETWLAPSEVDDGNICGWKQHNNSVGRGKGISTLYNDLYILDRDIKETHYQMTKIKSDFITIINLYRSEGAVTSLFLDDLLSLLSKEDTVIVGDFNLCFVDQRNHQIFRTLESLGFNQLVKKPTHIKGRMIDLVFSKVSFEIIQQSPFFTDHDIVVMKMDG